jgi:hypothetical protein
MHHEKNIYFWRDEVPIPPLYERTDPWGGLEGEINHLACCDHMGPWIKSRSLQLTATKGGNIANIY